jgi:hypothetical protein
LTIGRPRCSDKMSISFASVCGIPFGPSWCGPGASWESGWRLTPGVTRQLSQAAADDKDRQGRMKTVRTLPIRIAPIDGEAIDSWLEAIAHRTHTAFGDLLAAVGHDRSGCFSRPIAGICPGKRGRSLDKRESALRPEWGDHRPIDLTQN